MFESLFNQKTMYIDSSGLVMRNLLARQHSASLNEGTLRQPKAPQFAGPLAFWVLCFNFSQDRGLLIRGFSQFAIDPLGFAHLTREDSVSNKLFEAKLTLLFMPVEWQRHVVLEGFGSERDGVGTAQHRTDDVGCQHCAIDLTGDVGIGDPVFL